MTEDKARRFFPPPAGAEGEASAARARAGGKAAGEQKRIARNFGALLRRRRGSRAAKRSGRRTEAAIQAALVPKDDMHGFALTAVIAIMSFLAAWMLFAAYFISQSARSWNGALAREAIVQIMPVPGQNIEKAQAEAAEIAKSFSGIAAVRVISAAQTQSLLAPWLGADADIAALPVPRLVALQLAPGANLDSEGLSAALRQNIKGARFDGRQAFAESLARGAHFMAAGALALLALTLAAMAMTVAFAARGALAGNMHIVEVLHLIGADDRFIARRFDRYFFGAGLKGAACGSVAAGALLLLLLTWESARRLTPEGRQMAALFGRPAPDWPILAWVFVLIFAVAALTVAAGHQTLIRRLKLLDRKSSVFFTGQG